MKPRGPILALLPALLFAGMLLPLPTLPAQTKDSSATPPVATAEDSGFGPLDPAPPTGLTVDQVIEKFAAREIVFDDALQSYGFREDVRFQTLNESNKVDGEYHQTTDISYDS